MRYHCIFGRASGLEPASTETKRGIYTATSSILSPISLLFLPLNYTRLFVALSPTERQFDCHAEAHKFSQYLASFHPARSLC